MLSNGKRAILGFTVFAMFFGAGNLIFPVFLAYQAGESIAPAFTGFALTAIGFPMLALLAIGRSGSLEELSSRISPGFSKIFTVTVYLAIGPCLAIPRTAGTSYEMVSAALNMESSLAELIYSAVFFTIAAAVAFRPEKLSSRLGKVMAPILIALIAVLAAAAVSLPAVPAAEAAGAYAETPFPTGFSEGYQTMDAIAGLVFGAILIMNIRAAGASESRKEEAIAVIIGGLLLLAVYSALAFIGYRAHAYISDPSTGAGILSAAAGEAFPATGRFLIASIFIIACFNTSVSLLSSCGEYFHRIIPAMGRSTWILIFAAISCLVANAGLEAIISISAPVLGIIYPGAMVMIVLSFLPDQESLRYSYIFGTLTAIAVSAIDTAGIPLPLHESGFAWFIPSLIMIAAGMIMDRRKSPSVLQKGDR